jgi:hypothetical protein
MQQNIATVLRLQEADIAICRVMLFSLSAAF